MGELHFDTQEEADQYVMLRDKNKAGGFDTIEEANLYSSMRKKANANTQKTYWEDVWSNAKKEVKGFGEFYNKLTGSEPGGLEMLGGMAKGIGKTVLGALQAITDPNMIPVGGKAPETPETQQLAQESTQAFQQAVKPITSPIQSFREAPITTLATDIPIGVGAVKGISSLKGAVKPITQVPTEFVSKSGTPIMRTPTLQEAVDISTELVKVKGKLLAGIKSTLDPKPLMKKTIEGIKKPIQQAQQIFDKFKKQAIANAPKGELSVADFANSINDIIKKEKDIWGASDLEVAVNKIPKLKEIVFGDTDIVPIKDAIDFSSELSRKMSKNAKAKMPSTLSIPEQDLIDIRRVWDSDVLGNLPELKMAKSFYKPVIQDYNLLRRFANETGAMRAVQGAFGENPIIQETAMRYLDPQLAKELGDFQRVYRKANITPSKIPSPVDILKRKEMSHLPKTTVNKQKLLDILTAIEGK